MKLALYIAILFVACSGHAQTDSSGISVTEGMRWKYIDPVQDAQALATIDSISEVFDSVNLIYNAHRRDREQMKAGREMLNGALAVYFKLIERPDIQDKAFPKAFYDKGVITCRNYRMITQTTHFHGEVIRCYMTNLGHHPTGCTCGHCPGGRDLILMMRLSR